MTETTTAEKALPPTMKAAIATGFGAIDENIFIKSDWPTPQLDEDHVQSDKGSRMIIRVLACALAPGDVRLLSGKTSYVQLPKSGHPYIPGSDVCGIVVAIQDDETKFKVGDKVVSRFDEPQPVGGLAEYRLVYTHLSEIAPTTISPVQACGLPASAMAAKTIVTEYMKRGDRVLVLGGSGAVGTSVVQYAKLYGASFVAATTTQTDLVTTLGADQVVDYRTTNWWEIPEFQSKPFDVVFDMVNGKNWTVGGCSGLAVNRNGVYVALVTGVETDIVCRGTLDVIRIMSEMVGRLMWSRFHPKLPRWVAAEGLKLNDGDLKELFDDVDQGRLRVVLDPASPVPFTEKGVRDAFALQKSIHAHGKVVVKVADE